jgi:hypothetical protein
MSRWSRRTDAEKERIYEEQSEMKKKPQHQHRDDQDALEIYKNSEIPIMCHKCMAWTASDNYEYVKEYMRLIDKKMNVIKGHCRVCKIPIRRVMTMDALLNEGLLLGAVIMKLTVQGRFVDRRRE